MQSTQLVLRIFACITVTTMAFSADRVQSGLTKEQARKYLEHVWDTLFLPHNHDGKFKRELTAGITSISKKLLKTYGSYTSSYTFNKRYDADTLYKAVVQEAQEFICQTAQNYATELLQKTTLPSSLNKYTLAGTLVGTLGNEIKTLVNRSSILEPGIFTNYYGAALQAKLKERIQAELAAAQANKPVYTTPECPICFESFTKVHRLILACGHMVCAGCLKQWYYTQGDKVSCPTCRAAIAVQDFASVLWAPSAPPL